MSSTWPLTARGASLEQLGRWYADRSVGGVVLTGPAGVGKTRLGEEALQAASGRPTARAVGHPATRSIPLGALAHLLPADLARDVGLGEDDRAGLFHRARLGLTERADDQRLLLLVDDVDELDDTSLAILLPLTINRTIFLIATVRTGRPLPPVIASLIKDGHLLVETLPTLTRDEVVTLLHRVLDGPIETQTVDRLAAVSDGNLQVLQEVVRRAQASGVMRSEAGVWRLSELPTSGALDELVTSHLAELDADARRAVDALAVAGTMGLADLAPFVEPPVLEDLDGRGLIRVTVDGRRTRVTLAHPVYGEVIRSRMTVLRERALQRQLADQLEAHGARRREDVTRLALWRLEAGGDVEVTVLLRAGRLALMGRDTVLGARFAAAAAERGAPHEAAAITVEAAILDADPDAVEAAVASVWEDQGLADSDRVHLARRQAGVRFARGDLAGSLAVIDDAERRLAEPTARPGLLAQRALLLANNGRPQEALTTLVGAGDVGDPRVGVELSSARSIACCSVGRFGEAVEAARQGRVAQGQLPAWLARRGMAGHVVNEGHALTYAGRYEEARALIAEALPAARVAGALAAQVWFELVLAQIERDCGYGHAAVHHFGAATDLAARAGQHAALVWAWVGVAQGHLLLGDGDAAASALARADAAGDSPVATSWSTRERTRAWLLACRGDLGGARQLLSEVADAVQDDGIWIFEATVRHDLVRLGEASAVVDRLAELAVVVEGPLMQARAAHAEAAARRDARRYEDVIVQFEAMGSVVLAAEAAVDASDLYRRGGDQRAAAAMGQRAAQLVERSGGARTPGLLRGSGVEPLTGREREVAVLAAAGVPSREIAARLFVSKRTVDTHLDHVYRKLGVTGRDQLGAALGPVTAAPRS